MRHSRKLEILNAVGGKNQVRHASAGCLGHGEAQLESQSSLRIVYIGDGLTGTSRSRLNALTSLGHKVELVSFWDCFRFDPALSFKVYARLLRGPAISRFNKEIRRRVTIQEFDWIWVDKGIFVFPETVKFLRQQGFFLIHHLTDDFLNPKHWLFYRHYKRALYDYHVHLTSNTFNVSELRMLGVRHAVQTFLGYDHEWCLPSGKRPEIKDDLISDIVFVGFWRKHLDDFLMPLVERGLNLRIWGSHWRRSPNRKLLREIATFMPASDVNYPYILASSKIALCFLNHENRNTSTGRSFEIPAIGTFMLGERTLEHESFYIEGQEAEFFESPAELLQKAVFYLEDHEARQRIALAGHYRALNSGYSYYDRIKADLAKVIPIYKEWLKRNEIP